MWETDPQAQILTVFLVYFCTKLEKKKKLTQKPYCDPEECQTHNPAIHVSEAPEVHLQLYTVTFLSC